MWRNWFFPAHGSYQEAEEENEQVEEGEEENKRTQTVHTSSLTHRHRRELIGPSTTTNGQGGGGGAGKCVILQKKIWFFCVCVCFRQINKRENGHRLYSYNTQIFFFCLFHSFYEKKRSKYHRNHRNCCPLTGPFGWTFVEWAERGARLDFRGNEANKDNKKCEKSLVDSWNTHTRRSWNKSKNGNPVGRCCRSFIGSDCVIKRQTTQNDFSWVKKRWRRH